MAVTFIRDVITSGYNLSKINSNFEKIETALQDAVSRSGNTPNQMNSDLDMNSNDILNVNSISASTIIADGADLTNRIEAALNAANEAEDSAEAASLSETNAAISATLAQGAADVADNRRDYPTKAIAEASSIPANINYIRLASLNTLGDGKDRLYIKRGVEPVSSDKFQSADGAWWELTSVGRGIGDTLRFEDIADIPSIKLDSKIIFKKEVPTNNDAWDVRIWRDATGVTGGTPGDGNAARMVDTDTGAAQTSYEWNLLAKMTNRAGAGENTAAYFQATKLGEGQTWALVLETREEPGVTYGALVGLENACSANGSDPLDIRVITDVIAARRDDNQAVPDFFAGVRITAAWNGDVPGVESARIKRPLLIDANWTETAIFAYKRLAIDDTITSKIGLVDMFVPEEGGNTNEFNIHFTKTGATTGWETTGLFLDRVVDTTLVGRVAFGGDRSVSLSTGVGGSTATLVHNGGFAVPVHGVNPAAAGAVGQMIWIDSLNRLRVLGSDGLWHQVAFES